MTKFTWTLPRMWAGLKSLPKEFYEMEHDRYTDRGDQAAVFVFFLFVFLLLLGFVVMTEGWLLVAILAGVVAFDLFRLIGYFMALSAKEQDDAR